MPYDAVLLTSTTRRLPGLLRQKRRGIRIVQRLDGINWMHRRVPDRCAAFPARRVRQPAARTAAQPGGRLTWYTNPNLCAAGGAFSTARITSPRRSSITAWTCLIFTPDGPHERPEKAFRLLVVEGSLQGGYETGLATAVDLADRLAEILTGPRPLELMVVGNVSARLQAESQKMSRVPILWGGLVPHDQIPGLDRSAHLLYSADLNAACPNSVIEAFACGLPVAGFATGSLPELVTGDFGRLVPTVGDPWKLEKPDLPALAAAAVEILQDNARFRKSARSRAEEAFGLDQMVDRYLDVLLGQVQG